METLAETETETETSGDKSFADLLREFRKRAGRRSPGFGLKVPPSGREGGLPGPRRRSEMNR
jgi:hypothetical protein